MALSLSLIVIFGILFHQLFARMQLPGILGVLLSGILMGPYGIDMIDESIMVMSGDLRKIALVVILLRAGLGIKRKSLAKVGLPALKLEWGSSWPLQCWRSSLPHRLAPLPSG